MAGVWILASIVAVIITMLIQRNNPMSSWVIFYIKKGTHYSLSLWHLNPLVRFKWNRYNYVMSYKFKFNFQETCLYVDNSLDGLDINKLFGVSFGHVHKWSARLGWRCLQNGTGKRSSIIELFTYVYQDGKVSYAPIAMCNPYDVVSCEITVSKIGSMSFELVQYENGQIVSRVIKNHLAQEHNPIPKLNWRVYTICYPYFGGNTKAPHDIHLGIVPQ